MVKNKIINLKFFHFLLLKFPFFVAKIPIFLMTNPVLKNFCQNIKMNKISNVVFIFDFSSKSKILWQSYQNIDKKFTHIIIFHYFHDNFLWLTVSLTPPFYSIGYILLFLHASYQLIHLNMGFSSYSSSHSYIDHKTCFFHDLDNTF